MTGRKRALALFVAVVLLIALAGGCASGEQASSGQPAAAESVAAAPESQAGDIDMSETMTISLMYHDSPSYPFNPDWGTIKALEEAKNVKLDIQPTPMNDFNSKLRIVFSSGNLPDIVNYVPIEVNAEFSSSGLMMKIDDHLDMLPNFQEKYVSYDMGPELENWRTRDGSLYVLPFFHEIDLYNTAPTIRKDLLDAYGLDVPETFDDLYEVLKVFKEKNPDSIPMTNVTGEFQIRLISGAGWGIEGSYNGFMFDKAKNEFYYVNTHDNYKQYVTWMNKLMSEGLADPEIYTCSMDQYRQKLSTGVSMFAFSWISQLPQINADGKALHGEDFEIIPLPPLEGPGGKLSKSQGRIKFGVALNAKMEDSPDFARFMDFVDYMGYSDEGTVPGCWGIEGETYQINDGVIDFTDEVKEGASIQQALWGVGGSNNNFTYIFPHEFFVRVIGGPLTDTVIDLTNQLLEENWSPPVATVPKLDPEQVEEENMLLSSIRDYQAQMHEQFVFGKASIENDWDKYVDELNKKGVERLLEIYNATLN